jgi:hypothetical protein
MAKAFWEESESEKLKTLRLAAITFAILALELALIRWMGSQIRIFAYFSNLVLLAAFLGMGLGIALGRKRPDLVRLSLPLLVVLSAILAFSPELRLMHVKFPDSSISLWGAETGLTWTSVQSLVLVVGLFWLVAAVFLLAAAPVGWLFDRVPSLTAYSADLLGSLLGVIAMTAVAALNSSPIVWMLIVAIPLLWINPRPSAFLAAATVLTLAAISIRGATFSPYNRLDLECQPPSANANLGPACVLHANRDTHQSLIDISNPAVAQDPSRAFVQAVYELPFRVSANRGSALVVGAGTGNDVAAALRQGFEHVTSVEIDPAILRIGERLHPERPYADPRVMPIVNDARAYFEQNPGVRYDVVCYGLLDSHSMFSSMSSLRLENYVYTAEGIRAGWSHVKPDGVLSICFSVMHPWMADRLFGLIQEATGLSPVVIPHRLSYGITFVAGRKLNLKRFPNNVGEILVGGSSNPQVRLPTDDWPFLYLRPGSFPFVYVIVLGVILASALFAIRRVYGRHLFQAGRFDTTLFLMGAAFLLIETRMVTTLSLLFGSTWIVNSSVFAGILLTVFVANAFVARRAPNREALWYVPLSITLLATWAITPGQLNRLPLLERGIVGGVLYALPVAFAGIIFSSLLRKSADPALSLGSNLLGAVVGGSLEYLSMWIGLRSLTLLALALYLASYLSRKTSPEAAPIRQVQLKLQGD